MKHKKRIRILVLAAAGLLLAAGLTLGVLAYNGLLGAYHPLQTPKDGQIRVACVGDSVTYGFGIPDRSKKGYPAALQALLGDGYCVNNYGYSGRTLCLLGDRPYRVEKLCTESREFLPDIVVLMLGANDSKPYNWNATVSGEQVYPAQFESDLRDLIALYRDLPSAPRVYVMGPLPAYADKSGKVRYDIQPDVIQDEIRPLVLRVAREMGVGVIDPYPAFEGKPDLFSDGLHPTAEGAALLARTVYDAILG